MIDESKVHEAMEKTLFFWDVMDLNEEERIEVAKRYLLMKGEQS